MQLDNTGLESQTGLLPWESKFHGKPDDGNKRRVLIEPVSPGEPFHFEIDFHNLSQTELAQFCATLQPTPEFEHRLGMGKPLGLGSVKIEPLGLFLVNRSARYASDDFGAPRYHTAWRHGQPTDWPSHLQAEQETPSTDQAPTVGELAAQGMSKANPDVARALALLGNPDAIGAPVHYQQVEGGQMEETQFKWFMSNDKAPAHNKQALTGITADTSKLAPLIRIKS